YAFTTDVAVARFNADGSLDTSFGGGDGQATIDFTATGGALRDDEARALTLQRDGRIVLAGYTAEHDTGAGYDFAVARLNTDGSLDTTFGPAGDGRATVDFAEVAGGYGQDIANAVAVAPDGRIVLAGETTGSP